MNTIIIREILVGDNPSIQAIIKKAILEHGLPKEGTAYSDIETQAMYAAYQQPNSVYYVVEENGVVKGGGGIKPLNAYNESVCELQKMYFLPELRGKGIGKQLLTKCLTFAKISGFSSCYLETAVELKSAIELYKRFGFKNLDAPLGNTGHYSCGVWMMLKL